jgi:adenylylsulfate kinase
MKGIYVLIISIRRDITVKIGALGPMTFQKGSYAYVGSAQNNLEERIARHLGKAQKKFWHIDYLLSNTKAVVQRVFTKEAGKPEECELAERIHRKGCPIPDFGCSDCKCESHLFKIERYEFLREDMKETTKNNLRTSCAKELGWCVWITGLPGSGKSSVSEALLTLLMDKGVCAQLVSSDALRRALTSKPTYSLDERETVYSGVVYVSSLLTKNGVNVIIDGTGNLRRYRDAARRRIPRFMEAYLKCQIDLCMERERRRKRTRGAPRKIYAQALESGFSTVPGVSQPYEEPLNAEMVLDTSVLVPAECAQRIWREIEHFRQKR